MDKFQFWLYIIMGIVFLLSRLKKKPDTQPQESPNYNPSKPVRQFEHPNVKPGGTSLPKALTFEELLREITEGKGASSKPQPQPQQEFVDYDDDLKEEAQDLEEVDYDYRKKDTIYKIYDDAKRQAFNRPSLEDTMKVGGTDMHFEKFKVFQEEETVDVGGAFLTNFKDTEGFKKAFVMSEILQRRF